MRRVRLLFVLLLLSSPGMLYSNIFKGSIVDEKGNPVAYATIFIHELSTGVSANEYGEFIITLDNGVYTCEVSSLGYKRVRFTVEIWSHTVTRRVVLEEEVYTLSAATLRGRGEDRAVAVMRRAIARAPYHRQQVRGYESSVYLKGTMKITKIPSLLRLQAGRSKSALLLNKLFVIESHSKIVYTYPDSYKETILGVSSTIPPEIDPGNMSGVIRTSVYDKEFFGKLSPLAPNAFNYYRFVYEGISNESGRIVNKIRVTPKKGDSKLITGHIYIQDDTWDVSYLSFTSKDAGVTTNVVITYNWVKPSILMPSAYSADVKIDILGVNAGGRYNSSITYSNVKEVSIAVKPAEYLTTVVGMTNREARRVASATERRIKEADTLVVKKSLEIKRDTALRREVDSLAKVRDTTYWTMVRRLPLTNEELISYKISDSLNKEFKRVFEEDSVNKVNRSTGNRVLDKVLFEAKYKVGKKLTLGYGGLSGVVGDFNFTDGYQLGQNLFASWLFNNSSSAVIKPRFYYSTLRKELLWRVDATLSYSPLKLGSLSLSAGEGSADISNNTAVSSMINSYASFLFGLNPVKFHSRKWYDIVNSIDIANGLRINAGITWESSSPLENGDLKSLFGVTPPPNEPNNIYGAVSESHKSVYYRLSLSYTPEYYYRIRDGRKRYVKSRFPTFTLYTRATVSSPSNNHSSYGLAGMSISHTLSTGLYGNFLYSIDGGEFYKRERISLTDFRHFAASDIMVSENGFRGAFLLAGNYNYSTPESWVTLISEYRTDYLLLNRLPFINSAFFDESLHFKWLWLPEKRLNYFELGYSFGVKGLVRTGVFVGFDGLKYKATGLRIELPILQQLK